MNKVRCPKCNKILNDDDKIIHMCHKCGEYISEELVTENGTKESVE